MTTPRHRTTIQRGDSPPSEGLDRLALIGWCGEYTWLNANSGAHWIGGPEDHDFEHRGRFIEVKASLDVAPSAPLISINELRFGAGKGALYDVVPVGLDRTSFEALVDGVLKMEPRDGAERPLPEWAVRFCRVVGLDRRLVATNLVDLQKLVDAVATASRPGIGAPRAIFADGAFREAVERLVRQHPQAPYLVSGTVALHLA